MIPASFPARRAARPLAIAVGVVALSLALPPTGSALELTLLSSEANVAGAITSEDDNWSDSEQSLDLSPFIDVSQSFGTTLSSSGFVFSSHAVAAERLRMSTRSSAAAGAEGSQSWHDHDFSIWFSIDEAASYELRNGNSTGSFPRATATPDGGSASLVYELYADGVATPIFSWSAPSSGAAGTYQSGELPAGTYLWTAVASADAIGDASGSESALSEGNVFLSFPEPGRLPLLATASALLALLDRARTGRRHPLAR